MGLSLRPKSIRGKLFVGILISWVPELLLQLISLFDHHLESAIGKHLRWDIIWRAADILAAGTVLVLLFVIGNQLVGPIRLMSYAANALAAGDFRKRVIIQTNDELEALGQAINSIGESLQRHESDVADHTELMAGMVEAASLVSSSLDAKQCPKIVAKVMCEKFGASGAVVFRKTDTIKMIGRSGDVNCAAWKRLAIHAADSGHYLLVSEQRALDAESEAFLVGIPLQVGATSLGAIVARFDENTRQSDLRLGNVRADALNAFAIHAAAAISNADAFSRTEEYSGVLEGWVDHLSSIMQVTDAVSPSLTLNETLSKLAEATAPVLGADDCAIMLPDRHGDLVIKGCCSSGVNSILGVKVRSKSISGIAFAEKRPVSCFDVTSNDSETVRAIFEKTGLVSVLSVPLIIEGKAIGVISAYFRKPRQFTSSEIRLLTSIALHTAVLVRNASLYTRESSIAETLQMGLLSETPEECQGLRFADRYIPALDEANIGGDFYDVTKLPDGRVAVVMGDVSGKGLQAALHVAACKYMIKALMYAYPSSPARVLSELNDAINHCFDMAFFVTVFYGVIDPERGTLTYANAGHPPALLVCEEGRMHNCLSRTGIPVGSGRACDYEARCIEVGSSDMLLLYTDGVIDTVKAGELLGVEGLHDIVFEAGQCSPQQLIGHVCSRICNDNKTYCRDDVALMAVSFEGVSANNCKSGGGLDERNWLTTEFA